MPIKVAFDARALVSPSRGVQRYTQELYGEIARRGVPTTAVGTDSSMTLPHGVAGVPSPFDPQSNLAWCAWGLPAAARRAPFDVFHAPAYTAPLFGVHPVVVTLHDISYEAAPAWYPYKRDRIRRAFYRHSAARARAIITDATATRDAIVEHYGGPRARIHVVPLGVGAAFRPAESRRADAAPASPFVLAVGDVHARRNVPTLVEAIRIAQATVPELTLVLVGRTLDADGTRDAQWPPFVRVERDISDARLVALYQQAAVVAGPSLYEGFGLPLLEAMACGTPVVAAHASVTPDTTGDAAILVDPMDPKEWANVIVELLRNPERAADHRARGLRRAAQFTWSRTADATLAVFESVCQ